MYTLLLHTSDPRRHTFNVIIEYFFFILYPTAVEFCKSAFSILPDTLNPWTVLVGIQNHCELNCLCQESLLESHPSASFHCKLPLPASFWFHSVPPPAPDACRPPRTRPGCWLNVLLPPTTFSFEAPAIVLDPSPHHAFLACHSKKLNYSPSVIHNVDSVFVPFSSTTPVIIANHTCHNP